MLLRVDVYPENDTTISQTLHVTSNCAREKGELLLVGRKMGDILLSNDKTVSREHFRLRAVSANRTLPLPPPETNDQILACQQNDIHICVILENLGRLGTFWVKKTEESKPPEPVEDSATDDDATDDEGLGGMLKSQAPGLAEAALSQVSRALLDPAQAIMQEVGMRESAILIDLSKPKGRVVIQLGKLGSTIVITREIYRVCFTSTKPKEIAAWNAKFPMIGLEEATVLEKNVTTHLVTAARSTSLKQIAAWSMGIPIVSPDFLQALYDKKSAKDPMPNVIDFPPAPDGEDFWLVKPNPRLWKSYTMLSIKQDEIEDIVRATGAKVVKLHQVSNDTEALDRAKSIMKRETCPFGVSDSRRKIAKLLKQAGLLQVTPKQLIRCMTEQRLIEDGKGNVVGEATEQVSLELQDSTVKCNTADTDHSMDTETEPVKEARASTMKQGDGHKTRGPPVEQYHAKEDDSSVLEESTVRKRLANQKSAKQAESKSSSQRQKSNHVEITDDFRSRKPLADAEKPSGTSLTDSKEQGGKVSTVVAKSLDPSHVSKKSTQLEPGWLSAKPKGKARHKLTKNREEIRVLLGVEELINVAPTDVCKGLLVRASLDEPCHPAISSASENDGPDFKAFRKNPVPPTISFKIGFKSVLPTAPDRRENDEDRREVVEQQRRADELFRDVDRTASKRRRRS